MPYYLGASPKIDPLNIILNRDTAYCLYTYTIFLTENFRKLFFSDGMVEKSPQLGQKTCIAAQHWSRKIDFCEKTCPAEQRGGSALLTAGFKFMNETFPFTIKTLKLQYNNSSNISLRTNDATEQTKAQERRNLLPFGGGGPCADGAGLRERNEASQGRVRSLYLRADANRQEAPARRRRGGTPSRTDQAHETHRRAGQRCFAGSSSLTGEGCTEGLEDLRDVRKKPCRSLRYPSPTVPSADLQNRYRTIVSQL